MVVDGSLIAHLIGYVSLFNWIYCSTWRVISALFCKEYLLCRLHANNVTTCLHCLVPFEHSKFGITLKSSYIPSSIFFFWKYSVSSFILAEWRLVKWCFKEQFSDIFRRVGHTYNLFQSHTETCILSNTVHFVTRTRLVHERFVLRWRILFIGFLLASGHLDLRRGISSSALSLVYLLPTWRKKPS